MRRVAIIFGGGLLLAIGAFLLGPRVEVGPPEDFEPPPGITDLDRWLADREARFGDITPGAEARIVWADPAAPAQTERALLYFHGFSATRQETAPLAETLAGALSANLYEVRLRGHGRPGEALAEASVEQWFADALQALAVGRALGRRVIVLGTSTGGTLAVWLAARPEARDAVEALALVSPNFGVADPRGALLTGPWGRQIAELTVGEYREWTPESEARRRYWTWRYPTRALLPMGALVDVVSALPADAVIAPALVFYSLHDPTLDVAHIATWVEASERRRAVVFDSDLPGANHVLAGDILAPQRTGPMAEQIAAFVRGGEGR